MIRIRAENRAYDLHRPNGCTVLTIELDQWPGNEFGLWLPEMVSCEGGRVWNNWKGDVLQTWSSQNHEWSWKKSFKDCAITSTLRVDLEASCLWYSHEFENTSEQTLSGLDTQTCFHLVNAPEFISIHGERIWACLDGVWTTTDKVPRCESPDPRRVSFLGKGIRSERTVIPYNNFLSATMPEQACHPLIIAERFGASGSVGIACRNFRSLFNNNDCILRCIHSEPFPIEHLPPGERAEQQGVILFSEGDHTKMVEDFERLAGSVWGK